jgi:hypothetical protein
MRDLVQRAIVAGKLVGATNNAAIESGHDEGFEEVHQKALDLQVKLQCAIATELGLFTEEGVEPASDGSEIAWLLWAGDATEAQMVELLEGA